MIKRIQTSVSNFEKDAKPLHEAMKSLGTDDEAIIRMTTSGLNKERIQIRSTYKSIFEKDIIDDLNSEYSSDLKQVIVGMWRYPVEFDVL